MIYSINMMSTITYANIRNALTPIRRMMNPNIRNAVIVIMTIFLLGVIKTANNNYSRVVLQKKSIESNLAKIQSERDALVSRINDFESQIQNMKTSHEEMVGEITAEIGRLKTALSQKEAELFKEAAQIHILKIKMKKSARAMANLSKQLHAPKEIVADTSVPLQPVAVTARIKKIDGKILEINKEYGFIVINAGDEDGVMPGDVLFVFRRDNLLGKVLVEKVDRHVSVAKMLYKSLADTIRKEDRVSN